MVRERRQYPRVAFPFSTKYRLAGELMELWRAGTITNLSAGGLRFTCSQLIDKGTRLEFQVTLPVRDEPYLLIGQVIWGTEPIPDAPEYGVAFVGVTPDKQFEIDELVQFLMRSPWKT